MAEFNVGRARAPLTDARMAGFVDGLSPVNAMADAAPGFVWRLVDDAGEAATDFRPLGEDVLINLSVWESLEAFHRFTFASGHAAYLRRRAEWFVRESEPNLVMWWLPVGQLPDVDDGVRRLLYLRAHGPSPVGFDFRSRFDPAGRPVTDPVC